MEKILVIDDSIELLELMSALLEDQNYIVYKALNGPKGIELFKDNEIDLVLLDVKLPGMNGIEILEKIKKQKSDQIVIMVTGSADISDAVDAMKLGAFDYISKPFNEDELMLTIRKALKNRYLEREVDLLRKRLYESSSVKPALGKSPEMLNIFSQLGLVAPTNMSVIIQGESGTGKEVIANMIHHKSKRKNKPFVAVDCGAIPDTLIESELFGHEKGSFTGADATKQGKFEMAEGGTLLLDELTNLSLEGQAKLLRALEERKIQHVGGKKPISVDVRVIATSNLDILKMTETKEFRLDLYHRLNEFRIELPPLSRRADDVPVLAEAFMREANIDLDKKIKGFSKDAHSTLQNYTWPGNVRELKNVVKKAVLFCEGKQIEPRHLMLEKESGKSSMKHQITGDQSLDDVINGVEKELIEDAIRRSDGNKTKAASLLKINRKALYRKIASLGITL